MMASTRTSFTIDRATAERARRLKINVSAAAREGVEAAVRAAMARADREAYRRRPERPDRSGLTSRLDRRVTRGEIWFAEVGRKRRPVLVMTRPEVIDVRALVTVAEITTSIRAIAAEVEFDHESAGLDRPPSSTATGCTRSRRHP